jgi:hypothetical protein
MSFFIGTGTVTKSNGYEDIEVEIRKWLSGGFRPVASE